jgi:hypothetical protein
VHFSYANLCDTVAWAGQAPDTRPDVRQGCQLPEVCSVRVVGPSGQKLLLKWLLEHNLFYYSFIQAIYTTCVLCYSSNGLCLHFYLCARRRSKKRKLSSCRAASAAPRRANSIPFFYKQAIDVSRARQLSEYINTASPPHFDVCIRVLIFPCCNTPRFLQHFNRLP